jgi:hypothetical protein
MIRSEDANMPMRLILRQSRGSKNRFSRTLRIIYRREPDIVTDSDEGANDKTKLPQVHGRRRFLNLRGCWKI